MAILLPSAASACSCLGIDNPRAVLASAPGAFVGVIERVVGDGGSGGEDETEFHFRVEHAVKGGMGETVVVHSRGNGGMCGLEGKVGQRKAMFLAKDADGRWTSSLCRGISPERLLSAARPLPPPDGQGPPALVVGTALGEHRAITLDAQGRTLAYGGGSDGGNTQVVDMDMCPGSRHVVEGLVASGPDARPSVVAVRNVDTLAVERTIAGADGPDGAPDMRIDTVQCRGPSGSEVDAVVHRSRAMVVRWSGGTWRRLWEGTGATVALSNDRGSALARFVDRVERIDLDTGTATVLHRGELFDAALSPGGSRLALLTTKSYRLDKLLVLDVRTGAVQGTHQFAPEQGARAAWVDDDVFALAHSQGSLAFVDASLRTLSSLDRWGGYLLFATGGRAYGIDHEQPGVLLEAVPKSKDIRRLSVGEGTTAALVAVPPPPKRAGVKTVATTTTTTAVNTTTTAAVAALPPPPQADPPLVLGPEPPPTLSGERSSSTRPWAPTAGAAALLALVVAAAFLMRPSIAANLRHRFGKVP
jgi:hypothetical protein